MTQSDKFIEEMANKADEAGDKLIEFGKKMVVFAKETDFAEGLKDFIGNIRESLEEGLGSLLSLLSVLNK